MQSINFNINDRLLNVLSQTIATFEQLKEAVRVNSQARLTVLKSGLLLMALFCIFFIYTSEGIAKLCTITMT